MRAAIGPPARERLGPLDGEAFLARLEQHALDLLEPLELLYGQRADVEALALELVELALDGAQQRREALRVLDRRREVDRAWFQRSRTIGYVAYVDRFAATLPGVRTHLDYLAELGVTYLHLMPLLAPRPAPNDGGYAVADYRAIDARLGTMADLEQLADDLHQRGMALCVDLVLNHTAAEHAWARAAVAGDPAYRDFYLVYPDRAEPDRFEATLPQVFPDTAPGNFTEVPTLGWVWTTFERFQWDLNWANPRVFVAMFDTVVFLANRGVDVLRLDAVPFLWKRLGTDCQNQPEVHLIVQALRALTAVSVPAVVFKAEAIVPPGQLVGYLGAHERFRPECELAYHNQLMVLLWSSLAARDVQLARSALAQMRPLPPDTAWVTYLRCHDDIGWAITDRDAASVGLDAAAHRRFLSDFFAGEHPGSFARGARFQPDPYTGDSRISGTAAALCGLDAARAAGDPVAVDLAVRRLLMLYSVIYSYGGIPVVYMGDELGLANDAGWAADPLHAADSRWLHRPLMDWAVAERRHDLSSVPGRIFQGLLEMGRARAGLLALRAGTPTPLLDTGNRHLLAYTRRHRRSGTFLALANFSDDPQPVEAALVHRAVGACPVVALSAPKAEPGDPLWLAPWDYRWLVQE